jgi:hypothetical protein
VEILSIFAEAIPMLSGASYPTLNEAVPVYNCLFDYMEDFLGQCNEEAEGQARAKIIDDACNPATKSVLHRALEAAHAKLRTYYGNTWAEMYVIAVILDPRYQMRYFKANHWEKWEVDACKAAVWRTIQGYGAKEPRPDETGCEARMGRIRAEIRKGLKECQADGQSELERYLSTPMVECPGVVATARQAVSVPCAHRKRLPCHPRHECSSRACVLKWSRLDHQEAWIVER